MFRGMGEGEAGRGKGARVDGYCDPMVADEGGRRRGSEAEGV